MKQSINGIPMTPSSSQSKNMVILHTGNLPLYEGGEDPKRQWFISEKMLDVMGVINEVKQMMQFASALRRRAFTVYEVY